MITLINNKLLLIFISLLPGTHCTEDFDGCQDLPCTHSANCTDISAILQANTGLSYVCSSCTNGTEFNDGICHR